MTVTPAQVAELIARACPAADYRGQRVLVIVPEGTRTAPVGLMYRKVFEHDQVIIIGPVFPHEVVGCSGGNKYL